MANTTGVADHKATGPAIPGLTVERTKAIILLIVQLFSVAQTGLSIAGISQLPFTTDQVSTAITGVIAVIASVYAWWRNNDLTGAAVQGQQLHRRDQSQHHRHRHRRHDRDSSGGLRGVRLQGSRRDR